MPKNKQQKEKIIQDLSEKLKKIKSLILVNFKGLKVNDDQALRSQLKKENMDYVVLKKTLFERAAKDNGLEIHIDGWQDGASGVFSYEDEVAPAKIIKNFFKGKEDNISFVGGILEGKFLSKEQVEGLALIPSKPELYAKLVGSINAPISGFVNVLAGNIRGLVNVINSIKESKSK